MTKNLAADLEKTVYYDFSDYGALAGSVGKQGLEDNFYWKVKSAFKGKDARTQGISVSAYWLLHFIHAKKLEYEAFNLAKTAYETKKNDYNNKLTAAEKVTDAQKKDIFKAWYPTKEDTDALKAVPVRPSKPDVPAPLPAGTKYAVKYETTPASQLEGLTVTPVGGGD